MAGVTESATPRPRRARDAAASTAAIAAATSDAIAAGIAPVNPSATAEPAPLPVPAVSEAEAVALDPAAVLPDPTLTAEPGTIPPVVTASPPLAVEPNAVDVARRAVAGDMTDNAATSAASATTVAGQPTLAIESGNVAVRGSLNVDGTRVGTRMFMGIDPADRSDQHDDVPPIHQSASEQVVVVEVVGPPQGRRRAGFAFGPEPRRFLATQLTMAQLAAIRDDRLLTVGVSEVDADAIDWSFFA